MLERFEKFSFEIFEITRCWHKLASEEMSKYGLKGPHATYVMALYRFRDGITAPKICELCGKDKADVSRMMAIMEDKGLVVKESNGKNLYRGLFKLTEKGIEAAEHVKKRVELAVDLAGNGLNDEGRENFYKSLEIISTNLRKLCDEGLPT